MELSTDCRAAAWPEHCAGDGALHPEGVSQNPEEQASNALSAGSFQLWVGGRQPPARLISAVAARGMKDRPGSRSCNHGDWGRRGPRQRRPPYPGSLRQSGNGSSQPGGPLPVTLQSRFKETTD